MTELSKRPTPESNAFAEHLFVGAPAQSARFPTNTEWLAFARSLEQRLGAAVGALEFYAVKNRGEPNLAYRTLAAIKAKP